MKLKNSFKSDLLLKLEKVYSEMSYETEFVERTDEIPYSSLIIKFHSIGAKGLLINLQLNFLPIPETSDGKGIQILQSFVELVSKVNENVVGELIWAITKLNLQLPIGFFGVLDTEKVLYFKYNSVMVFNDDLDHKVQIIDRQNGLILHNLNLFLDTLIDISNGSKTGKDALIENKFFSSNLKHL